jgi:hypothetical protein
MLTTYTTVGTQQQELQRSEQQKNYIHKQKGWGSKREHQGTPTAGRKIRWKQHKQKGF